MMIMCGMRGRGTSVFKENPGTSGRARIPNAVEQPDGRGGRDRCANGSALGEHPRIEGGTVDANETTKLDVREITPANQVPEMTLGETAVEREGLEVEELRRGLRGLRANPSVGRFC